MKKSSYQKLKEENAKLKEDIYNLIQNDGTLKGFETKMKYKIRYRADEPIMFGNIRNENLKGIINIIKPSPTSHPSPSPE